MADNKLYLMANIPQWGIFLGIVFIIISYIDKKDTWAYAGWILLMATAIFSLAFNVTGGLEQPLQNFSDSYIDSVISAGWQSAAGGALAAGALLFLKYRKKNYRILAILTVIYFLLIFFQFNSLVRSKPKINNQYNHIEQK